MQLFCQISIPGERLIHFPDHGNIGTLLGRKDSTAPLLAAEGICHVTSHMERAVVQLRQDMYLRDSCQLGEPLCAERDRFPFRIQKVEAKSL